MEYRNEWKHEVNEGDLLVLQQRLDAVMEKDAHAKSGSYLIRSLYFDNPRDTALCEKLNGVDKREKYRIRCYDNDFSFINLEKKVKCNGVGKKRKTRLTADQVRAIIDGHCRWMVDTGDELIMEFYCKILQERLEPKVIVQYRREPYVYAPGNVRVTLDTDLRTGRRSVDFLNPDVPTIHVRPGIAILEVKWDEFLPDHIKHAVDLPGRRTAPFSKYAACRMFD